MNNFIDSLSVSTEDKIKLRSIGADNPGALLGAIYAVPEAMAEFIGQNTLTTVTNELEALLTPEQKEIFNQELPNFKVQPFLENKKLK